MKIPQVRATRLVDVCILTAGQQKEIENSRSLQGGPRGKQLKSSIPYSQAKQRNFPRYSNDDTLIVLYAAGTMQIVETL